MKYLKFLFTLTLAIFFLGATAQTPAGKKNADTATAEKYNCPMKCEGDKSYSKAGKCPECGMALSKIKEDKSIYQCPMKCEGEKTYDKPGKCPECGMDISKIKVEAAAYKCPMKCEGDKTYTRAGQCPVCKMDTKKIEQAKSKKPGHEGHNHD